eukprot:TRINITY_DN14686_c0_g2_i1.p1 TRINITY_DN14686_c0_g2~~TRINITY_DN14686_c0_g2_i1.p1  ORF type:complete len:1389 (-),score=436.85 TRINITY_DN14686_c0_g2_i1:192-4307(-)
MDGSEEEEDPDVESDGEAVPEEEDVEEVEEAPRPRELGMSYEKYTTSYVRMNEAAVGDRNERIANEAAEKKVNAGFRGSGEVQNLQELLRAKFGSTVRGWRFGLDLRNLHRVGKVDFFKAMRSLGYPGSSTACWAALGGDLPARDGVSLADVDAEAAKAVGNFYREYTTYLGKMHNLVEKSYALVISKEEFLTHCKLLKKYDVDLDSVFMYLNTNGVITSDDCAWLEHHSDRRCTLCGKYDHPRCRCTKLAGPKDPEPGAEEARAEYRAEHAAAKNSRKAADEFRRQLQHFYGSTVAAWRKRMDPDGTGVVTNEQMLQIAQRIGFKGDIGEVWVELTGGGDYTLKLEDLEPRAEQVMAAFDRACRERFGGFVRAFRELEARKKPMVSREEFHKLCIDLSMEKNHKLLFDLLDDRRVGVILLQSINEEAAAEVCGKVKCEKAFRQLQELEPIDEDGSMRKTLMQRTAEFGERWSQGAEPRKMHEEFLKMLTRKFGSPIRAWSVCLDIKNKGKLTKEEFGVGISAAGFGGNASKIWEELGLKPTASIKLKDFAPTEIEEMKTFKTNFLSKLSDEKGFIVEDKNSNREITSKEFEVMCRKAGMRNEAIVKRVFQGLDLAGKGYVMSKTLRWLHEAKSESKALPSVLHKYKDLKRKAFQERMTSKCQRPLRETLKAQDALRETATTKLASKNALEQAHKSLIRLMCKRHGGVARAWQKVLDPDRKGELSQNEFLEGLRRIGFLAKDADKERITLCERLFKFFADEETRLVSLAGLDPYVDFLLAEFKTRCVDRFGSLSMAFKEFNPEAAETIPAQRFKLACHQVQLGNAVHRILEYLDPEATGEVRLDEISEQAAIDAEEMVKQEQEDVARKERLDMKEKRAHMADLKNNADLQVKCGADYRRLERKQEAMYRALREFKEKLCHRHGTLVKAWRKVFKAEEVFYEEFKTIYEAQGLKAKASLVWRALGMTEGRDEDEEEDEENEEDAAVLTLLDLDTGITSDLEELRARIFERFGSGDRAFKEVGANPDFTLDLKMFLKLCYEANYRGNERRLFEYLDKTESGMVALEDIDSTAVKRLKRSGALNQDEEEDDEYKGRNQVAPFKAMLRKRFGKSLVKAWRNIDKHGSGMMTRAEFGAALPAIGYRGSLQLLWNGIVGKDATHITLRDVDGPAFKALTKFYKTVTLKYETLKMAFLDEAEQPVKQYSQGEFYDFCKEMNIHKSDPIFNLLANNDGFIAWDDIRFLEEQWTWEGGKPEPVRKRPPPPDQQRPPGQYAGLPMRMTGEGPLKTNMRPQRVTLRKCTSLPLLSPQIRPQWNDRHQIKDTASNKTEQLIHLMAYVQTQSQQRIKIRVAQRMEEEPIGQWLVENVLKDQEED